MTLLGHHHRSHDQQQELRDARRQLKERIRTDWEYATLPQHTSSGRPRTRTAPEDALERIAGFRFHNPSAHERPRGVAGEVHGLDFEPVDWREREYSSASDVEDDEDTPTGSVEDKHYKFEDADSVGAQVTDRRQARTWKRLRRLHVEMEWNDGLAHWIQRRDVWCGARTSEQVRVLEGKTSAEADPTSASASAGSSPRTSTSSTADAASTAETSPATTPDVEAHDRAAVASAPPSEVLVPIAPTILPDHPVRRRITSNLFPEIYNKIILQSRTPSVPINLQTLIRALVQGWKDDGEWPPKSGRPEKSVGKKKASNEGSTIRQGVKAVGRVLRLTGVSEIGSPK